MKDCLEDNATNSQQQQSQPQPNLKKSVIESAIDTLLQSQNEQRQQQQNQSNTNSNSSPSMGLLGERTTAPVPPLSTSQPIYGPGAPPPPQLDISQLKPDPGSILVHPYSHPSFSSTNSPSSPSPFTTTTTRQLQSQMKVRTALPTDDPAIANLRLSVFSNFSPHLRHKYCQRSCEILNGRRMKGATCLVAFVHQTVDRDGDWRRTRNDSNWNPNSHDRNNNDDEWVLGSAECSMHEFAGTELGRRRPRGSLLYVTEVAVSPSARKCGVGTMLMKVCPCILHVYLFVCVRVCIYI